MSKSRSDFKSSTLTNINTRGGPIKEGLAPVATNYLFSGTGALRLHRPPTKPLFTKRREYCLMGKAVKNAPANTECRTAEQIAADEAAAALLARAQAVASQLVALYSDYNSASDFVNAESEVVVTLAQVEAAEIKAIEDAAAETAAAEAAAAETAAAEAGNDEN